MSNPNITKMGRYTVVFSPASNGGTLAEVKLDGETFVMARRDTRDEAAIEAGFAIAQKQRALRSLEVA